MRVVAWSTHQQYQRLLHELGRRVWESLQEDRQRHLATAGMEVDSLLAYNPPLVKETWIRIRGWQRKSEDQPPPPPVRVMIGRMATERADLYRRVTPTGRIISVAVTPFMLDDSIPEEEEVAWEVRRLRKNMSGGGVRY